MYKEKFGGEVPCGHRAFGRPRTREMTSIKKCFSETGCQDGSWMELASHPVQGRSSVQTAFNRGVLLSES
jgi:hypothetical protein